MEGPIRIL